MAWAAALIIATYLGVLDEPQPHAEPARPAPSIPRHYPHIRIAQLAYASPFGPFEYRLLTRSVDLRVPHAKFLDHNARVAPRTPKLIYSNFSHLSEDLLIECLR